jgi:hypothetical protein
MSPAEAGAIEFEEPDWPGRFLDYVQSFPKAKGAQRYAYPELRLNLAQDFAFEHTLTDWRRFHGQRMMIDGKRMVKQANAVDGILALAALGVMPPRSINQNIPRGGPCFQEQHNDHIWLTVKGEAWAIRSIEDKVMHLWRGWEPDVERMSIDLSRARWSSYCDAAVAFLKAAYPG